MHEHELDIDASLVGRLLAEQLPHLSHLPLRAVRSTGTVNAIYRLGEDLCVRLPRLVEWAPDLDREATWLPVLSPHLTLQTPEPIGYGRPGSGYPCRWAVYAWLPGRPYDDTLVDDEQHAAERLAGFLQELRAVEPVASAPAGGRPPLLDHDASTRTALRAAHGVIDSDAAIAAWELALEAPVFDRVGGWIHSDLLRPNLLVDKGRLSAVIDFGGVGVGDPAADVIAAWSVFGGVGRAVFRAALEVDDGTWERARGFALLQAAMIIPYYAETNPGFVELARRTIGEIVGDTSG